MDHAEPALRAAAAVAVIRSVAVLVLGVVGLLALLGDPALAYVPHQHCEPLRRSR